MLASYFTMNQTVMTLLSLSILWLSGFLATRVTKFLRLPNVTGYILAGILIGPYALRLIPEQIIAGMDFMTDAALSFIAFGVGRYLRAESLRRTGGKILILTIFEAITAAVAVTLTMYFAFGLSLSFSLLLGAIGSATAPASSLMTIRQYRAKGPFVDTLVQVVALDDAVALIAFSVTAAVAEAARESGSIDPAVCLLPILENIAAISLGAGLALLLRLVITRQRSKDHRLALICAFIFGLAAFCASLNISPLLSCMVMGTIFANTSDLAKPLFKQINRFTPPILMMFFVLSGMRLNLPALKTAGIIGASYFIVRIAGKYAGAYLGARITGASASVRRCLGLALIPQAGVSIGLAVLGQRLLPGDTGVMLSTIILSSSVLYEMIGPLCAKRALSLSGSIPSAKSPTLDKHTDLFYAKNAVTDEEIQDIISAHQGDGAHWSPAANRLWVWKRNKDAK